jgi:hypothetical protein
MRSRHIHFIIHAEIVSKSRLGFVPQPNTPLRLTQLVLLHTALQKQATIQPSKIDDTNYNTKFCIF